MVFNKIVFLVRHGNPKDNGKSDPGLSQHSTVKAISLARFIKEKIGGETSIRILSSPKNVAIETAEIIAKCIGEVTIEEDEKLCGGRHNLDTAWLINRILEDTAKVVIVISHEAYVKELPECLGFPEYFPGSCDGVYINEKITRILIE